MALDTSSLVSDMLIAAKPSLAAFWKEARPYAEKESKGFAENLAMIASLKLAGKITEQEALLHVQIQKNAYKTVLMAIEGLGIIAAENAINAAVGAIRNVVNTTIGWNIL